MMRLVFTGNGGNPTIALLHWAQHQNLSGDFLWVDTGFAHHSWKQREKDIKALVERSGLQFHPIKATPMATWVKTRHAFPSQKFPWCASVLKGLPLNAWLDEHDPESECTVVLAKSRCFAPAWYDLTEYSYRDPKWGNRTVWHPLWQTSREQIARWIQTAGFDLTSHRALECDPCVYNTSADFQHLTRKEIERVAQLEQETKQTMFGQPIQTFCNQDQSQKNDGLDYSALSTGCSAPYGCGL